MNTHLETTPLTLGQITLAGQPETALPLEKTAISGQLLGPLAIISIEQTFRNPFPEIVDLEYLFPVSHQAAIVDFEMHIGSRHIRAELQESEQARQTYDQARFEGRQAALFEQRRPNLFSVKIANVLPGESLRTALRYQELLDYVDGEYQCVIPMGLTPKYHSPEHPEESKGVDAPLTSDLSEVGPVTITLSVDAGHPVGAADNQPHSPSHPLSVSHLDERRFQVTLAGEHIPNKDFVLRYATAQEQARLASWVSPDNGTGHFLVMVMPPAIEQFEQTQPREIVYVLDRSGSMSGKPIHQAVNALKASLRTLRPGDQFRILLFDYEIEWYHRGEAIHFNQDAVDQADRFLSGVEGRGGTEIVGALKAALDLPQEPEHQRIIVLLTDGSVSGEERALGLVREQLKAARLFTFGIGPSVNRAFIQRLAQLGRGTAEFLGLNEDIEGAIIRFQDRLAFPMLVDLKLDWGKNAVWDVYPKMLPDLYADQPLVLTGRCKIDKEQAISLHLLGRRGNETVKMDTALRLLDQPETAISRLWARSRVDDLLEIGALGDLPDHQVRNQVIGLAMEHRLVTPFTSFVAVDSQVVADSSTKPQILIAQPLPEGLDLAGFVAFPDAQLRSHRLMAPEILYQTGYSDQDTKGHKAIIDDMVYAPEPPASPSYKMERTDVRFSREVTLRELARTQKLNGSWDDDIEQTVAALLVFLQGNHTPHSGHFRTQMQRTVKWLLAEPASGFSAYLKCYAIHELAGVTGLEHDLQAAEELRQALPQPASKLQRAIWAYVHGDPIEESSPVEVESLEDLWLAVILNLTNLPISPSLAHDTEPRLVETLLAALHHTY
jgi:Ca-activated chloride channel homolog